MKLPRRVANAVRFVLDELLPPAIRDSRWLAKIFLWPVARDRTALVMAFRERVADMSAEEFAAAYRATAGLIDRDTDLGPDSLAWLVDAIRDRSVLEVGAGRGHLARELARHNTVTACDFVLPDTAVDSNNLSWREADAEQLPFADSSFDVVVCTHTLEHVRDFERALGELRRVGRERLYVVVPLQRPYRWTADLHISYFPYPFSFLARARPPVGTSAWRVLDGDLCYEERLGRRE
jgi:SAM-dependent methyltransferase